MGEGEVEGEREGVRVDAPDGSTRDDAKAHAQRERVRRDRCGGVVFGRGGALDGKRLLTLLLLQPVGEGEEGELVVLGRGGGHRLPPRRLAPFRLLPRRFVRLPPCRPLDAELLALRTLLCTPCCRRVSVSLGASRLGSG